MAQRPPRACYVPQQIPQGRSPVYRIRKGATHPHPAGQDHDCGHERYTQQDRKCPRLQHRHAGPHNDSE